jgi:hypothetical protein
MRKRMDVGMKRGHVLIRIPYSWRPEAPRGPPPQRYALLPLIFLDQTDTTYRAPW